MSATHGELRLTLPEGASTRRSLSMRGFSLIELLVVAAIAMVIAAVAIPTISTTMDGISVRGALNNATTTAQRARIQAIKRNTYQRMHFSVCNNRVAIFVTDGTDANACPQTNDPLLWEQTWLATDFGIPGVPTGAGAPAQLTTLQMWGTNNGALNINTDPYFNSRGLPCQPIAGAGCANNGGFVYYYQYQKSGRTRWAATSISPAGRIQGWTYNGSAWGN